jgi:hypothetical protein
MERILMIGSRIAWPDLMASLSRRDSRPESQQDCSVPESNPFKRDRHNNLVSPGAISDAMRADPKRAKELCLAAGEDARVWFATNRIGD